MFDLYLGSDLGLWALQEVSIDKVKQVLTVDSKIRDQASKLGVTVINENPNLMNFTTSKVAFSIHYPKILKSNLISQYRKIYNLHPSFLPFGRGYYPIFWALWENTPAGATLHEINEGIDQGNIVAQTQVEYYEYDTGETLFNRVREAEKKIFWDYWPKISEGMNLPSYVQQGKGTYHSKKEFFELKKQVDWQNMKGQDLIRLIRCLSFEGYTGLEIELEKHSFEVSLKLLSVSSQINP